MQLELHQLELRYEKLRRKSGGKERRLLASLSERGQLQPVVVVQGGDASRYVLVDGYKRLRALRRLKHDTVQATAWDLGELEALLLERVMRVSEADSALDQGLLLVELNERFALTAEELARRFDKSASWVSQRLGLVRALPEEVRARVQSGAMPAHAATKYLVPMARASRADCIELVTALDGQQPSTRDVAHLYTAWLAGDERNRKLLLAQPHIVLRAREEARLGGLTKLGAKARTQTLHDDLSILIGASRRARAKVDKRGITPEESSEEPRLGNLTRQARWECDALFEQLARRLTAQRPSGGGADQAQATVGNTRTEVEVGDAH